MAQSLRIRQSRSYESEESEPRRKPGATECPKCHSDDVKRSRRKFYERFILPVVRAQVYRCRDCKHRYLVGMQWGLVILAVLTIGVTAGVFTALKFENEARLGEVANAEATAKAPRHRLRRHPVPKGLPPLSSIPRPADDPVLANPAAR